MASPYADVVWVVPVLHADRRVTGDEYMCLSQYLGYVVACGSKP